MSVVVRSSSSRGCSWKCSRLSGGDQTRASQRLREANDTFGEHSVGVPEVLRWKGILRTVDWWEGGLSTSKRGYVTSRSREEEIRVVLWVWEALCVNWRAMNDLLRIDLRWVEVAKYVVPRNALVRRSAAKLNYFRFSKLLLVLYSSLQSKDECLYQLWSDPFNPCEWSSRFGAFYDHITHARNSRLTVVHWTRNFKRKRS